MVIFPIKKDENSLMKELFILVALFCAAGSAFAFGIDEFVKEAFAGVNTYLGGRNSFEIVSQTIPGTAMPGRAADPARSPISLEGKAYEHGLGMHADTRVRITFGEPMKRFSAVGGID